MSLPLLVALVVLVRSVGALARGQAVHQEPRHPSEPASAKQLSAIVAALRLRGTSTGAIAAAFVCAQAGGRKRANNMLRAPTHEP